MRHRKVNFVLLFICLLALLTLYEPARILIPVEVKASDNVPLVHVDHMINFVYENETCIVNVDVFNVTELYGFEFKLDYNTTFLNATQIVLESFINAPHSIVMQEINETLGRILFAATSLSPAEPANGSGTLARITFLVETEGDTVLKLYDTKLANIDSTLIPHDVEKGYVHSTPEEVSGYVSRELLVEFYGNVSEVTINETITRLGAKVRSSSVLLGLGDYNKIYWLKIVNGLSVWETIHSFQNESVVKSAEPNYPLEFHAHQEYPNDRCFPHQWGMCNAGQKTVARETCRQEVTAVDSDVGTELVSFNGTRGETYRGDIRGALSIYLDRDGDRHVTLNDIRLTPVTVNITAGTPPPTITYLESSLVVPNDFDLNLELEQFPPQVKHDELVKANDQYDYGEWIYIDADGDNHTSVGDTRLLSGGTIDADIDAPQAWSIFKQYDYWRNGNPVVAIIDSGVDSWHLDLRSNLLGPPISDPNGHGTHVAGTIGAQGDNYNDVAGVNWKAQILPLRATTGVQLIFQMGECIKKKEQGVYNIRVINLSLAPARTVTLGPHSVIVNNYFSPQLKTEIRNAGEIDILVVASAGNYAMDVDVGEYIYRDVDNSNTTSVNDIRLTDIIAFHPGPSHPPFKDTTRMYKAGTTVHAGDWDALSATPLISFATEDLDRDGGEIFPLAEDLNGNGTITDYVERYYDWDRSESYSSGERIYLDVNADGIVNPLDVRLTPFHEYPAGSLVAPGNHDISTVLRPFADNERHVDNKHIDGKPQSRLDSTNILRRGRGLYNGPGAFPAGKYRYDLLNIINVAASNHLDHIADFSNYGWIGVDLAAPGEDIISLAPDAYVTVRSGTSMAAPHVTGIASLAFAMFPDRNATEVKYDILFGTDGTQWPCQNVKERIPPASGVDVRLSFGELIPREGQILSSGGRLRWPYTGDLGDAPRTYDTVASLEGAVHWDDGNEWFGPGATNEVEVTFPPPPYDQDPTENLKCTIIPDKDLQDHPRPVNFVFDPPPPWNPGQKVNVSYTLSTNYLGVNDAEGGRYQTMAHRMIYVNGFFDWNRNLKFDPATEHAVKHILDLAAMTKPGTHPAVSPPKTSTIRLETQFEAKGTPLWIRFRIDYGEHVGIVNPNPTIPDPPTNEPIWGLPGFQRDMKMPVWRHMKRCRHGEVEDWSLPAPPPENRCVGGFVNLVDLYQSSLPTLLIIPSLTVVALTATMIWINRRRKEKNTRKD